MSAASFPPGSGDLSTIIAGAPLVICLGPGGVGKTTISSVLALRQAAAQRRALVLTIDPARRLADALGLAGLTNDPAPVTSFARLHPGGSLHALMLDPTATFDHLVAMLVIDPERRAELLANRFYQHLSRSLAGTLEYMAVERLHDLVRGGHFDAVVLDTPPTHNALDFIDAPERLASFFSEKVTRWFMPEAKGKATGLTARLFQRAGSTALTLLGRIAGDEFAAETAGFFGAFADLLGSFRDRGVEVGKLLRDPRTVFFIVTAPEPGRAAEARAIDQRLREAGITAHGFIVNRVDQAFVPGQQELEAAVARATTLLGGSAEADRVRAFVARLEALRQARESQAARHAEVVVALRAYASPRPVVCAPQVPASESPRAALLALYVGMFADTAVGSPASSGAGAATLAELAVRRRTTDG